MTRHEFYHSKTWREFSRAFLTSKLYVCERCGGPASIAHHRRYLNERNVNDPRISLNRDNLEALCMSCHNQEHFRTGGGPTVPGLRFNDRGELVKV